MAIAAALLAGLGYALVAAVAKIVTPWTSAPGAQK
jgi:hypothetical protein